MERWTEAVLEEGLLSVQWARRAGRESQWHGSLLRSHTLCGRSVPERAWDLRWDPSPASCRVCAVREGEARRLLREARINSAAWIQRHPVQAAALLLKAEGERLLRGLELLLAADERLVLGVLEALPSSCRPPVPRRLLALLLESAEGEVRERAMRMIGREPDFPKCRVPLHAPCTKIAVGGGGEEAT